MKKVLIAVLMAMLLVPCLSYAADMKIAIVDMEILYKNSEPGKHVRAELQKRLEPMHKELERLKTELKRLTEEFKNQAAAYSLDTKRAKELEIKRKYRDLEDMDRAYKQKALTDEKTISEPVKQMMEDTIQKYIDKNGYNLVLEAKMAGVMYMDENFNITGQLVQEVNQVWKK